MCRQNIVMSHVKEKGVLQHSFFRYGQNCCLLLVVQPLADTMANCTSDNRSKYRNDYLHVKSPPPHWAELGNVVIISRNIIMKCLYMIFKYLKNKNISLEESTSSYSVSFLFITYNSYL